ncbi:MULTISPECIES: thioredoxin domain-containing protein [unclassified Sphingopyxis]|uniref:thioredoxin domain-containing protein n=1 Tax=unclassified Sphingopyxis TaxID=2614943 RepID=UPI00073717A0|nr:MULTISPECIES: thioredoxin domain-containing protein [unclassified Sphingopyxis]KTE38989.1 protein-disulfide isomerase [Sphingopyxis sp. HIX]KTE84796.1 protein-disulfide isomerase [Sphingopyxis sp. HXXIV]
MKPFLSRSIALAAAAALGALTLSAVQAAPAKKAAAAAPRWSSTVTASSIGAYTVGNPAAKIKLVEYFSYTCHVCGDFAKAAGVPLKTLYVDKGLVLFEYRNLVRDPIDMTAALLARCGGPKAFAGNHAAIFAGQPALLDKVTKASDAQKTSWFEGTTGQRARKIAADTGLTALMSARGYTLAQQNACLDNEVAQAELTGMTNIGRNADRVGGTPTFFLNGRRIDGVAWPVVKSQLDLALKAS